MALRPITIAALSLGGFGTLFATAGLLLFFSDSAERDAVRAEALPVATADLLRLRADGDAVLVEGRLAPDNPPRFRDFVAYRRERYAGTEESGGKEREVWTHVETVAPPLAVETAAGCVAIVNERYELMGAPRRWGDGTRSTTFFGPASERAYGFFAGDRVTVDARVVASGRRERTLEAVRLFGGDRADYLTALRGAVAAAHIVGGVLAGAGILLVVVAAWLGIKGRTSAAGGLEPGEEDG
jgi:hypothetical protein